MARGRARTPEAEAARREKIRQAVKRRIQYRDSKGRFTTKEKFIRESPRAREGVPLFRGNVHVLIVSDYRKHNPHYPQRHGIDYDTAEYATYIDPSIASNPSALQFHLNQLHPYRVHYRARVVEYL